MKRNSIPGTQTIIWTACPNGLAANGNLRVSVAIGPQLATGPALAQFPDWLDWPAAGITWQVSFGELLGTLIVNSTVVPATVVSAAPSSALYKALFTATTPVDDFEYESPQGGNLFTPPSAVLRDQFSGMYAGLAANLPPDGGWHSFETLADEAAFGVFPATGSGLQELLDGLAGLFPGGGGPIPVAKTKHAGTAIGLAYKFLQPRSLPGAAGAAAVAPPSFDFHEAYSLLQRHPALLRLFGFVVDLEVPVPSGFPSGPPGQTVAGVSAAPKWTPKLGVNATTDISPATIVSLDTWLPVTRKNPPAIVNGLLPLSNPDDYSVLEMDVDGAVLKSLNFIQAISNAFLVLPSADTPPNYAVPSLRSGGLALSMPAFGEQVYGNWVNYNSIFGNLTLEPVLLYAEDITQGYRVDVWDSTRERWYQLCARSGNPDGINGYGIGNPQHIVPIPAGDEGWVEPTTTQAPGTVPGAPGNPEFFLPETLLRWDGWSLVAQRPGKYLSDSSTDGLVTGDGNAPPPGAAFQVQIEYDVTPGTLPVLRFGRTYQFLARVVDLAGNSLPFDEAASSANASVPVAYGRLEPVPSPVVMPCAPRATGESLETLVIRSNYDIPDASVAPCERHLAPPVASVHFAETHGVLDDASGGPNVSLYATLAARDGLSYRSASVLKQYKGVVTAEGSNEWIYYPPGSFGIPYLPDPLGCGASLLGLPGAGTRQVIVPFGTGWPDRRAVRLVVEAGGGEPVLPPAGQADGPLTVHAPKASVSTVRLSSWFPSGKLSLFKLWEWLQSAGLTTAELAALESLILDGGHYMFTPYRELTIVHAVRQPLIAPTVSTLTATREQGATYAYLSGTVEADTASTQRIDVLSAYTDPHDDGVSDTGTVLLESRPRVGELLLEPGAPSAPGQADAVPVAGMRHEFGDTRHHVVYVSLLATTRFLEYFAVSQDAVLSGTAAVAVSEQGFAQGTVAVRGTGAHASVTYAEGTDFTENDATGTIARIASGRIASGATVTVRYVAPPVTRSSPQKYRLDVPSSARPSAPDVRYVIPAFGWNRESSGSALSSTRQGRMLRVYLGRPWFQTGEGEYLGVIVANPAPPGQTFPLDIAPYVSGYGRDPVVAEGAGMPAQFALADFPLAVHVGQQVRLAEQAEVQEWAGVAGHAVSWDSARKLWYADIAMDLAPSYFPFVQLALVRYQPGSLAGIKVSRVVMTDFVQVAPDRTVQLTFPSATSAQVTVTGAGYLTKTSNVVRAYVQEATVKTADADLAWTTVASSASGTALAVISQTPGQTMWSGKVTLPSARGTAKYRVLVAESEQHAVVRTGNAASRVTYLDAIEI